jgi:hypothetical protein
VCVVRPPLVFCCQIYIYIFLKKNKFKSFTFYFYLYIYIFRDIFGYKYLKSSHLQCTRVTTFPPILIPIANEVLINI